jgi:hypothetical protein
MPDYSAIYQDTLSITQDDSYAIPVPGNWNFLDWQASAEAVGNSKIELFWDETGDGSNLELVSAVYTKGAVTTAQVFDPNIYYNSTGNSNVIVRRSLLGGVTTPRQIYAQWHGSVI